MSQRQIAERTGVDQGTVSRDLAKPDADASTGEPKSQAAESLSAKPDADASKPDAASCDGKRDSPLPAIKSIQQYLDALLTEF